MTRIVVMGVSGSGKSTVAAMLAERLGLEYVDADWLHPKGNVDKMQRGIPLEDEDRGLTEVVVDADQDHVVHLHGGPPCWPQRRGRPSTRWAMMLR